jgi:hypothetical protein
MSRELDQVQAEIEETGKDLKAFVEARDVVRRRVIETKDQEFRLTPLLNWSGTDAVLGTLDLAVHAIERTLAELRQIEKALQKGRKFRVVDGETDGGES